MKPLALAKAVALVALAVALEAGFLLHVSLPPRDVLLAAARRAPPPVVVDAGGHDEPVPAEIAYLLVPPPRS